MAAAGLRAGLRRLLRCVQLLGYTGIHLDCALIGLGIACAFGQVQWADARLAAVAKAPKFAVPMAVML